MKENIAIAVIALCLLGIGSCGNVKSPEKEKSTPSQITLTTAAIQILYFHGDRRCPTCLGIAEVSENLYKSKYACNTAVNYTDINIDREQNRDLAKKYKVTGSSLIIDIHGKANDITYEAFKFVLSEPDSLKNIITGIVEKGLRE